MDRSVKMLFVLLLPLKYLSVTSSFGYRMHPLRGQLLWHAGVDLEARHDTVYTVISGKTDTGYQADLGNYVTVSDMGFSCTYGHLSRIFVLPAGRVIAGQALGITGATGRVTGEHLHFSVRFGHKFIDPLKFLQQINYE